MRFFNTPIGIPPTGNTFVGNTLGGLYTALTTLAYPLGRLWIWGRQRKGREDPDLLQERFGYPSRPRPPGQVLWVHCASVGEAMGVLGLVDDVLARHHGVFVLLTTGTVTSARLLRKKFLTHPRVCHQMMPFDWIWCVRRFLTWWQPDMALMMESDLWPQTLRTLQQRAIPTALINAQLSPKSYALWRCVKPFFKQCTGGVAKVFAVSPGQKKLFEGLGLAQVDVAGSLKWTAPALTMDAAVLAAKRTLLKGRRVCVAASTHPGEEAFWVAVFKELRARYPGMLLILVPRHVHRAPLIVSQVQGEGLRAGLESFQEGENSVEAPDVLVVDRMGLLGLCYRLAEVAFVGGSLIPGIGGHTLIEPLVLGVPVVHGPHMTKQAQVQEYLDHKGITHCVQTVSECVAIVSRWLEDDTLRAHIAQAGRQEVAFQREKVLAVYRQGLESLGITTGSISKAALAKAALRTGREGRGEG